MVWISCNDEWIKLKSRIENITKRATQPELGIDHCITSLTRLIIIILFLIAYDSVIVKLFLLPSLILIGSYIKRLGMGICFTLIPILRIIYY